MAVISNGVVRKTTEYFTPASWNGIPQPGITPRGWGFPGAFELGSYAAIYKRQAWVAIVVKKLAKSHARLPLKVYLRDDLNRPEAPDHPYAQLLRRPSSRIAPFVFWEWTRSTYDIYGEAVWLKVRDRGGRPVELLPWHPTRLNFNEERGQWELDTSNGRVAIARRDFVLFRTFNPDSIDRGLSPLEPLRATLENEEGARRANSALWRNGGRPSVSLRHPQKLTDPVVNRIRTQWAEVHGGVDNWAKVVVLEEGMEAVPLPLNVEELQYIEARKMNREEVCAIYDVPPSSVGILDRATFSNIVEQLRSFYRDTQAPVLKAFESTMEMELRDGRMGADVPPDFGEDVYAEFLMDEVLRGDFEARAAAYQAADYMTMAEKRRSENLPFIEGTDVILVNTASATLETVLAGPQTPPALAPAEDAPPDEVRSVMGRLGRASSLEELDIPVLLSGLSPRTIELVAKAANGAADVPDMRRRLRALTSGG